jgi:hypothetical protein
MVETSIRSSVCHVQVRAGNRFGLAKRAQQPWRSSELVRQLLTPFHPFSPVTETARGDTSIISMSGVSTMIEPPPQDPSTAGNKSTERKPMTFA